MSDREQFTQFPNFDGEIGRMNIAFQRFSRFSPLPFSKMVGNLRVRIKSYPLGRKK